MNEKNENQNEQSKNRLNNNLELNKMGTMPIGKLMFNMSLPAMISMVVQSLYNIINSIFVGIIGESALAAVTLIFPVQLMIIAVGAGTGVGLNSLISRRLGEGRFKEANLAATHGLLLSIASWLLFLIFGLFFSSPFVRAFSDNPAIVNDGISYCTIVTVFSLFVFVQINVEKIFQASGNMILPMISSISGAVANILINPILIFGLLGFPRLGVTGAAIGTILAQFMSMVIGLVFLFKHKNEVSISFRNFKLSWITIKNIYAVGLPSIIMQSIGCVMLVGLNAILIAFSEAAVAVLGVYFRLQSIIFMPVFGLTQGAMPIFGYNYGAKRKDRLMEAFKLAMKIAVIVMAIGMLMFQIFPVPLLKMFSASPEMLSIGVTALRIISTCFIFSAVGIICATLFQATAHGILSTIVSLLRQLLLILPLAWILPKLWGLDFVWLSFPLAEFISLFVSLFFLKHVYKKDIANMGSDNNSDCFGD